MKKIITLSVCSVILVLSANTMAFNWPWKDKKETTQKTAVTQTTNESAKKDTDKIKAQKPQKADTEITLYAAPASEAIIKQVPVDTNLVVIFRKGDWVKVGDRQDGTTGWVDINQYREAKRNFYRNFFHEKTETLYFHSEKGKDGKMSMTAYRNGKKLSQEETDKLFNQLQNQEQQQWQEMQRINNMMNFPFMMMPGIVVIEHQPNEKAAAQDKKTNAKQ